MQNDLIHDWNIFTGAEIAANRRVALNDETLRDGLQNPSVHDPSIAEKIEILHLMESLGIDTVNIGLPGAGPPPSPPKRTSRPSSKFPKKSAGPSRPPRSSAPARFAAWSKIGPSIICSAPPKSP